MMNIKILMPIPEEEILVTLPFGSRVYGTMTEDSDLDFIKIMKQDTGSLQLQYTNRDTEIIWENTTMVDYVYTDLKNFLNQAKSGANTVFFECLHTQEFRVFAASKGWYPELDFIMDFYTPWQAKAYLGLAKRDLAYPERDKHVARCIWMAEKVLKKELIDLQDVKNIPPLSLEIYDVANKIADLRKSISYDELRKISRAYED